MPPSLRPCFLSSDADGIPSQRYVTVTPPVMQKLTGLGTCPPSMLAAEVSLPPPADLLGTPRGQLTRVLALDGIQVGDRMAGAAVPVKSRGGPRQAHAAPPNR